MKVGDILEGKNTTVNFNYSNLGIKTIQTEKEVSPLFTSAKIYLMHIDDVVNGFYFTKEAVEDSLRFLYNIPIVGTYLREEKNFLGHEGEYQIVDDEIQFIPTTVPIGLVPESAELSWESVTDSSGVERQYLVCNNAYIWNRDPEMVEALKNDTFGQSMEISILDNEITDDGINHVKDYYYRGFCVLGIDRDGVGYVQPAFDNAKISAFDLEFDTNEDTEFSKELHKMKYEFDMLFSDESNDDKLAKKEDETLDLEKLLAQYSLTIEDVQAKVENYQDLEFDELKKLLGIDEKPQEPDTDPEQTVEDDKTDPEPEPIVDPTVDPEPEPIVDPEPTVDVTEYEEKIALLEEENGELKDTVKSLEDKLSDFSAKIEAFEKANYEKECLEKISEFTNSYGLDSEVFAELDVHKFETIDKLESHLFETLGRLATKKESKETGKFTKIPQIKVDKKVSKESYASLFED